MKNSPANIPCAMSQLSVISWQVHQFSNNKSAASKFCNNDLVSLFLFTVKYFLCIWVCMVTTFLKLKVYQEMLLTLGLESGSRYEV